MSYVDMLTAQRVNVRSQMTEILDRAEAEKRELTVDDQATLDTLNAALDSQGESIRAMVKRDEDAKATDEMLRNLGLVKPTGPSGSPVVRTAGDELRSALCAPIGGDAFYEAKRSAGDPQIAEIRALSKLSAGAGANAVPTTFYGKLWANLILTANLINAGVTVLATDSGETIQVPITLSHSTATLTAEAATIGQSDPVFGQRAVGAYKYAVLLKISRELLDDTGVDIEGYIAMQAGRAVGNALGADLVTGIGVNKPSGLLQTTTLGVTGGAGVAGAPTFDNLFDLFYSVLPVYRNQPEASWLLNDTTVGIIRKLKDGQGRYLWEASLQAGAPDTILNKPVVTDPNMPATALSAKSVAFGDLSSYLVRTVSGVRFERSVDFAFDQDLITYRCILRADGILVDQTGAVKHFLGNAA